MLNVVNLCGRLTADPELKCTPSGVSVTSFSLAVERSYKSGEERQTDFIDIVAWRGIAEFVAKYFKKGKMMIVSGSLQKRDYAAKDGTKRYITEVVANNVYFAGDKDTTNVAANVPNIPYTEPTGTQPDFEELTNDEDLPF